RHTRGVRHRGPRRPARGARRVPAGHGRAPVLLPAAARRREGVTVATSAGYSEIGRGRRTRSTRPRAYRPLQGERDEILRRYLPPVRRVVQRLAIRKPPHIELDDLVSWGIVGLLDAIEKYDPAKEALFSTYAQFRIRGAILDHLRSLDWVPRSVRQKA